MSHRFILPALALGLLLSSAAAGQHHHVVNGKMDYDDPTTGGDPNPPAGCAGVQAKVTITSNSSSFSPATITIDPGEAVCWTWSGTAVQHNVRADDGAYTSGPPEDRVVPLPRAGPAPLSALPLFPGRAVLSIKRLSYGYDGPFYP